MRTSLLCIIWNHNAEKLPNAALLTKLSRYFVHELTMTELPTLQPYSDTLHNRITHIKPQKWILVKRWLGSNQQYSMLHCKTASINSCMYKVFSPTLHMQETKLSMDITLQATAEETHACRGRYIFLLTRLSRHAAWHTLIIHMRTLRWTLSLSYTASCSIVSTCIDTV